MITKKLMASLMLFLNCSLLIAGEITVEGNFMGKNIFVTNPYRSSNNVGFCVTEVFVNGKLTTDEIQQSSFEIDLISFEFVSKRQSYWGMLIGKRNEKPFK